MVKSTLRYAVVGVIGTILHFGTLYALVEGVSFDPVTASAIGFIVALIASYLLNRHWTFEHRVPRPGAFFRYLLVSVFGLLLNSAIMFTGTHVLEFPYLLVQFTVVFVVPAVNYLANHFWAFRDAPESS